MVKLRELDILEVDVLKEDRKQQSGDPVGFISNHFVLLKMRHALQKATVATHHSQKEFRGKRLKLRITQTLVGRKT